MSKQFGEYTTFDNEEFGSGGFGSVYLAKKEKENENEKRLYVIKVLHDFIGIDLINKQYFNNEIDILNELKTFPDNKYTPIIYDFKKYNIDEQKEKIDEKNIKEMKLRLKKEKQLEGKHYYVIDYFSKGCLHNYLKKNLFPEKVAKLIFKKILKAVQFLHNHNICHLDIKPDNIIFDKDFNIILLDYGFAAKIADENGKIKIIKKNKGPIHYKCPEIWEKGEVRGIEADIFYLGVTLFKLVTGKVGFYYAKITDSKYEFISKKNYPQYWEEVKRTLNVGNLSEDFKDLYVKMVAYLPEDRPTSIKKILEHNWLKEVEDEDIKFEEETKKILKEIYESIKTEREIKTEEIIQSGLYHTKAGGNPNEEFEYFKDTSLVPKKRSIIILPKNNNNFDISNDRININPYIKINGVLNAIDFMNHLANTIVREFNKKCFVDASSESLKLILEFNFDGKETDLEIEMDSCKMTIELFEYEKNDYLLEFLRKEGEYSDFYELFLKIKEFITKIL